jgi:8-oxo-dGTP pyrophosphatase MutT (NUDIX family)
LSTRHELLTIYDQDLNEIGVAPRSEVHTRGLLHQVVHCWLLGRTEAEDWLYLQQRSSRTSFSGWYDIAAAGHVNVGESLDQAVVRETQEELGIIIDPEKLKYIGSFRESFKFGSYLDNEVGHVYLYPLGEEQFQLGDEVERMIKVSIEDFARYVDQKSTKIRASVVGEDVSISVSTSQVIPHSWEYYAFVLSHLQERQVRGPGRPPGAR